MQNFLMLLLILIAGFCIPASADPIITILEPLGGFSHFNVARAVAIDNSNRVVGNSINGDTLATLWILTGSLITPGILIPDEYADSRLSTALDIHDNGDLLLRSDAGSDLATNFGTCADPPCVRGAIFGGAGGFQTLAVAHFGGGLILSNTDFTSPGPGFEEEWLSSRSLWGPIQPRTSNQLGETIHNFGDFPSCNLPCGAFVRPVPEPASIWLLLGLLGVVRLLRVCERRKSLRL